MLLVLPLFLLGQSENQPLSAKNQAAFNNHFFEAQRYKQIGRAEEALQHFKACSKLDKENTTVIFEIGKLLLQTGQKSEAIGYLEQARLLDAENTWIARELVTAYQTSGNLADATTLLVQLCTIQPDKIGLKYELAELYYQQKAYKACIDVLNEIETLIGINPEIISQKKDIYLLLNDADAAERELLKLVKSFPANNEYKGTLAHFYVVNKQTDKAILLYREMIADAPNDPRAHLDLANLFQRNNQFDSSYFHLKKAMASSDLEVDAKLKVLYSFLRSSAKDEGMKQMLGELLKLSISANPQAPKLYAVQGDYYLAENNKLEARNSFARATRLGENDLQIWSSILLLDAELGMYDTLATDAERSVQLYPNQPMGYLMGGSAYLQIDKPMESINLLEAGLDFVIDNPELEEQFFTQLAAAFYVDKQFAKSDSYFEKALKINPNNAATLNNYAFYLAERGFNLDKALEMTARSNKLSPRNGTFLDTWAWVLYKNGQYTEALGKIEEALTNGGDKMSEVVAHYAEILDKLDRATEAEAAWQRAAQLPGATQAVINKAKNIQNP